ncbi:UNVERIFIED_CONTAM: putative AC9 transposase [Sesamum calycinum]|uniref:AC9 transposase n=1 Tax=Sesamum calycinum TaxID=2727403 RepID=A0AAW2L7T1_9LAMI
MERKSELLQYLSEPHEKRDEAFDILNWWKTNSSRYPVLSRVARDVLATPVSTIASEQAFSTSGRLLDPYKSSLDPKTVEALICAQSWLCSRPINIEVAIGEIEKYEEMHEEFMTASSSITHDLDD